MNRETDPLVLHSGIFVHLEQQDGRQSRLPVVTVDDVGAFIGFQHVFQGSLAEEGEPHCIVVVPVGAGAVKEVIPRVRLDEEAFEPAHEADIDSAVNGPAVPGHRKVVVVDRQPVDAVVTHPVVFGEEDLDIIAPGGEFAAQSGNHVAKTSFMDGGRAFRSDHHDIHCCLPLSILPFGDLVAATAVASAHATATST